jgi:hypothetical protein
MVGLFYAGWWWAARRDRTFGDGEGNAKGRGIEIGGPSRLKKASVMLSLQYGPDFEVIHGCGVWNCSWKAGFEANACFAVLWKAFSHGSRMIADKMPWKS